MREILFKGKRKDNGDWVEGFLLLDDREYLYRIITKVEYSTGTFIDTGYAPRVKTKTVGQYTGLTDKNGTKIFEGDIVKTTSGRGFVNYYGGCFCVHDFNTKNNPAIDLVMLGNRVEVVGNIHDERKEG